MPEQVNNKTVYSLFEVTINIQKAITERFKSSYWIKAEMSKLNYYRQSGHCYPDLVEKKDGQIIAQIRCNLWRDDYLKINSIFQNVLNEPLKDGIKILFLATIGFHPQYGLSLRIIDIDPGFTLGDLEREKQETIKKLKDEGIFQRNKTLRLSLLPQRIAIISVQTSNGYADFLKVAESAENAWGYKLFYFLFPSLLQGDKAIGAISFQLKRIKKVINHFDMVAIIRGGGGDVGLSCYNNYQLAKEIAMFPIPVMTGIGHATNETVVEMVAFENAITPTKLAEYLIQKFHNFLVPVQKAEEKIIDKSKRLINDEKAKFYGEVKLFQSAIKNILIMNRNNIKIKTQSLFQHSIAQLNKVRLIINQDAKLVFNGSKVILLSNKQLVSQIKNKLIDKSILLLRNEDVELKNIETNVNNMSPKNVMKRGYSFTSLKGKAIKSFEQVKEGDTIKTILFDGNILSTVQTSEKPPEL